MQKLRFPRFSLFVLILTSSFSAMAEITMICHDVPGHDLPRYYKLEESFGKATYKTRLGGKWIEACSDQYMPLGKSARTKSGNGTAVFESLSSEKRDKALACEVTIAMSPDHGDHYRLYRQFIIDFELGRYQIRENRTGEFRYQGDFSEKTIACLIQ